MHMYGAPGAVATPPQEAEEAYDLIQEVEWNRELSNTITLIGHLGCVHRSLAWNMRFHRAPCSMLAALDARPNLGFC